MVSVDSVMKVGDLVKQIVHHAHVIRASAIDLTVFPTASIPLQATFGQQCGHMDALVVAITNAADSLGPARSPLAILSGLFHKQACDRWWSGAIYLQRWRDLFVYEIMHVQRVWSPRDVIVKSLFK